MAYLSFIADSQSSCDPGEELIDCNSLVFSMTMNDAFYHFDVYALNYLLNVAEVNCFVIETFFGVSCLFYFAHHCSVLNRHLSIFSDYFYHASYLYLSCCACDASFSCLCLSYGFSLKTICCLDCLLLAFESPSEFSWEPWGCCKPAISVRAPSIL